MPARERDDTVGWTLIDPSPEAAKAVVPKSATDFWAFLATCLVAFVIGYAFNNFVLVLCAPVAAAIGLPLLARSHGRLAKALGYAAVLFLFLVLALFALLLYGLSKI